MNRYKTKILNNCLSQFMHSYISIIIHTQFIYVLETSTTCTWPEWDPFGRAGLLSEIHSLNSRTLCCALLFVRTRMNLRAGCTVPYRTA